MKVLVTGAGGFIGWHLTNRLKADGNTVFAVDLKLPQFAPTKADHFRVIDLRLTHQVNGYFAEFGPFDEVYALAADMGGIGFIEANRADIMRNNVLINCNCLHAAVEYSRSGSYLFTSSACVYPVDLQAERLFKEVVIPLKEDSAYPAQAEEGYGWEKLYTEMMCKWFNREKGLPVRIARLHNIYGPYGTYEGGREKAPAALCRKIAEAEEKGGVEIWGNGKQIRTFCYVDDCVEGLLRIMRSGFTEPVNLGSDKAITITDLAKLIMKIANKEDLDLRYQHMAARGVFCRSSDNSLLKRVTDGWEPSINYKAGLTRTYDWIRSEIKLRKGVKERWQKLET